VEASSSFPLASRISLLAAALLAALVWILRLLARRLIRVLAGLCGVIARSILPLTIPVGTILFVITSPFGRKHMTTEHTVVSFRQIKKKAVQFSGRLLANYRDLCLQLTPRAERHIQHMHMRFYRCRNRSAIQCLCDFLSAGFLLC
jgi:hypothetical protein